MKKPDSNSRNRNILINNCRLSEGNRISHKKKKTKLELRRLKKQKKIRILAPKTFCLNGARDREDLINFIKNIKQGLKEANSKIHISFRETNSLLPCGTLYFRAHMSLMLDKYRHRITCSYPKDDVVGQLFQHIKLLEKMGLSDKYKITADNVKHWHSVEGIKAETSKFENLLHSYEDELAQPMKLGLYDSMSEAVINSVHHAYEADKSDSKNQKWWMFSAKKDNNLTVAIYDAGIGIANSLRIKPELKDIMQLLAYKSNRSDRKLLMLAVGSSKSKTKLPYRGKGLPEMMQFVKSTNVGGLLIHSNHATYMYNAQINKEVTKDFFEPIKGTLIQWTIPLIDEV